MEKRIRWRRSDSIFSRTMLMLSLLLLITLLAMFFFVTSIVNRNQRSRFLTVHADQLQRVAVYVDGQIRALEQTSGQLLRSNDTISLMVNPRMKNSDIGYRVISSLKNSVEQNELIHRAFLYLPSTGDVYSSLGNYLSVENSGSRRDIEQYLAEREASRKAGEESETRLLYRNHTLFTVTDFCVPNFIGALFLEVDLEYLRQQIQSDASGSNRVFLVNPTGEVLLADDAVRPRVEEELATGSYLVADDSLAVSRRGAGENFLLYTSPNYGFSFGIQTDPAAERVRPATMALTLVPFLAVYAAFSLLYSLYITQRIYRPINRLMQITEPEQRDISRLSHERGKNELDYLEEAFQSTLGENRQHKELLAEISQDVLGQLFGGIINGTMLDRDVIRTRMEGLGLTQYLNGRYMALAGVIRPVHRHQLSTVEEGLYHRSLLAILSEYRKEDYLAVFFFVDNERLAMLLCFGAEESAIQMKTQAGLLMEHVRGELSQLPYNISFGRGKIYNEITSLRFSWQEALEDINYQNYLKDTPPQERGAMPDRTEDEDQQYFLEQAAQLADLAEKEKVEDIDMIMRSLARELTGLERGRRAEILEGMVDALVERMIDTHVTPEEIREMALGERLQSIGRIPDTPQEKEQIHQVFLAAARAIHTYSRKNQYKYVDAAKEYISAHYSDGNLSLNEVSEAVGISAPYLSAIFAEIHKGGFSSYLSAFRVETAKRFLVETTQNVSEIGYKCGFNSAQSFSRVFKKQTGLAPGQYREKNTQEGKE